jgi:hypothetical protein
MRYSGSDSSATGRRSSIDQPVPAAVGAQQDFQPFVAHDIGDQRHLGRTVEHGFGARRYCVARQRIATRQAVEGKPGSGRTLVRRHGQAVAVRGQRRGGDDFAVAVEHGQCLVVEPGHERGHDQLGTAIAFEVHRLQAG